MLFVSWNVNGLRACISHGFLDFVIEKNPDIIAIQETKMMKEQADFQLDDYHSYWFSAIKKGYSGTLILTKKVPLSVSYGIDDKYLDEGRIITLEYEDFFFVNVYVPNSQDGLKRILYRMEFEDDFRNYLSILKTKKHVIVCGDLNVAHQEIDIKNPKANVNNPGFSIFERNKITELLASGYIDTYRYLYPNNITYTWWSYRFNARKNNIGWRIDYFLVNNEMIDKVENAYIYDNVLGSDHCPIGLEIKNIF